MTDRDPSKPTEEWVTGDEPMTGPQQSYLETLAREAGEEIPEGLTKAQASELIDRLQQQTGRGDDGGGGGGASSSDGSAGAERPDPDAPGNFLDADESEEVPEPNEPA